MGHPHCGSPGGRPVCLSLTRCLKGKGCRDSTANRGYLLLLARHSPAVDGGGFCRRDLPSPGRVIARALSCFIAELTNQVIGITGTISSSHFGHVVIMMANKFFRYYICGM